jgi:hypothetical protein
MSMRIAGYLLPLLWAVTFLQAADLRLGIVGTDITHVVAFTRILNEASDPDHVPGARVVAAYKGGSPDIVSSRTRVDKFAEELKTTWKVRFYPDIPSLCENVDAVLLESGDGRIHLAQARLVIAARKPMFIDKPLASTLEDAREIARLAQAAGVSWFSSSAVRFGKMAAAMRYPDATGVLTWGPGKMEEHHYLDLSWYAIHPIELLYTIMGPGCAEVTRVEGGDFNTGSDEVVGRWKDGRIGSVRLLRPTGEFGAVVFRPKAAVVSPPDATVSYVPLVKEIVRFFETRKPPVSNQETLEIFAFLDAAQRSKEAGGKPMRLR